MSDVTTLTFGKTPQPAFHGKINRVWRLHLKPQCFSILYTRLLIFESYMGSNDTTETLLVFLYQLEQLSLSKI